jgi:Acetyltransferase (GNAT) domain
MNVEEVAIPAVRSYRPEDACGWEELVARACNGTFLHTRRFISYHGDRFRDRSLVLENRRGRVVGVFPAAEAPADPETVISHPGLTYGGVVHDGSVRGAAMIGALDAIASHYRNLGYRRLRYKVVPSIYHALPAEDDLYALFRLGARSHQCDLSAAVDLANRGRVTKRRLRSRRRADNAGVRVLENWYEIAGFWQVLEHNLASRHGASPLHSIAEINMLNKSFPNAIILITAKIGIDIVGGTLLFLSSRVSRVQYTATTEQGRAVCATDPVMEYAIDIARKRGCRYFDFGTCTLERGQVLHQDLYHFKVSFGGRGVVYGQYELDLL